MKYMQFNNSLSEHLEEGSEISAGLLVLRLSRHPIMVRAIMTVEGLALRYSPQDLAAFANHKAMAVLRPLVVETPLDGVVCAVRPGRCAARAAPDRVAQDQEGDDREMNTPCP